MHGLDEIVIDPLVPGKIAERLTAAGPEYLIGFSAPQPPSKPSRAEGYPPWWLWGGIAAACFTTAFFIWRADPHPAYDSGAEAAMTGLIVAGFITLVITVATLTHYRDSGSRVRRLAADARAHHRHYVVPRTDLDRDAQGVWSRVVRAVDKITRSSVVERQLIDSVRVSVVLPHHLWDIAEKLARLSALRAEQHKILHGLKTDDPDVAVVLSPQRRTHQLVVADVERQVKRLEAFAYQLSKADAAVRREKAVRRLASLNDPHADLLARIDRPGEGDEIAELTHRDARAVIEQANEAVKKANEAGRSLVLPDRP